MVLVDRPSCSEVSMIEPRKPTASSHITRDLLGKRHGENDLDAPRAKRRFERVSAQFERFRISEGGDDNGRIEMDTDSEEEGDVHRNSTDNALTEGVVEEPDDSSNGFLLGDYLKDYLERMKQENILPSRSSIKGNELAIWRPLTEFRDPFEDPTMKGRIQEVDGDETSSNEGYIVHHVSESGDSESENEMPSYAVSAPKVKIEELTDQNRDAEGMECD
ncbi:hypothetical protein ANCDUO_03349 [Ancylostoma duodenale]|uniref:Uncharacterized protein n=1 Tax=Ancylostoma duodenale TaxID=51022 RepID=A0A0C2D9A3_9BILA|nr:hypothetical protein ANCDUO_03349 [Ancylostoma duodenale]